MKIAMALALVETVAQEREKLAERDKLLVRLGMRPEDRSSPGERYCATTDQLRKWVVGGYTFTPWSAML